MTKKKKIDYKYVSFFNKYHEPLAYDTQNLNLDNINSIYAGAFVYNKDNEEYRTKFTTYTYKNNFGDIHSEFLISDKPMLARSVNPFNILNVDIKELYNYIYNNFLVDSGLVLVKISYQRNSYFTSDLVGFTMQDKNGKCSTYYITPDHKYTDFVGDDVCFDDDTINYK
ncbi:MAG: hypothetical protein Kow0076_7310 [Francisella sp.]